MAKDFIQEIIERILNGIGGSIAKRLGLNNVLGDLLGKSSGGSSQPKSEPSDFVLCKDTYKGELPEGLFAFVDYQQTQDGEFSTKIFVVSKDYNGKVTLNMDGTSETISVGPCERKYFEAKLQPKAGTIARVSAGNKEMTLKANYDSFPAYYLDGDMFINDAELSKITDPECKYINENTKLAPSGAASMIFGISKTDGGYEPQDKNMLYYAVVEKEKLPINDKESPNAVKFSKLESDKKYYYFAFIYDAGRNFLGGYGSEQIIYKS